MGDLVKEYLAIRLSDRTWTVTLHGPDYRSMLEISNAPTRLDALCAAVLWAKAEDKGEAK